MSDVEYCSFDLYTMAGACVFIKVYLMEGASTEIASSVRAVDCDQTITQLLLQSCEKHGVVLEGGVEACRAFISGASDKNKPILIDRECWDAPVVSLIDSIGGANCIRFRVTRRVVGAAPLNSASASQNVRMVNAFTAMMAPDPGISLPKRLSNVSSGRDRLYNDLLVHLKDNGIGFRRDEVHQGSASRWLKQLAGVFFFVEPYRKLFEDRGRKLPDSPLEGQYNDPRSHGHAVKRLEAARLRGHIEALNRFIGPGAFMEKRKSWKPFREMVERMLQCFDQQVTEMSERLDSVKRAHSSMVPVRTTADCVDVMSLEVCQQYPPAFEECQELSKQYPSHLGSD